MAEVTSLFDLVLTGQLAQGVERSHAIIQLAQLFKMPPEKIDSLMHNAPVVLKRELAWDVAKRYRVAIKQAGALSDIRPADNVESPIVTQEPPVSKAPSEIQAQSELPKPLAPQEAKFNSASGAWALADVGADVLTPSERTQVVSRLDDYPDFSLRPSSGNLLELSECQPDIRVAPNLGQTLNLLPPGTAVLTEYERALPVAALVVAGDYDVAALGERLSNAAVQSATAPDVSHIGLSDR
jgi:hypothetical protein